MTKWEKGGSGAIGWMALAADSGGGGAQPARREQGWGCVGLAGSSGRARE